MQNHSDAPHLPARCSTCEQPIKRLDDLKIVVFGGRERNLHRRCYNSERRELGQGQPGMRTWGEGQGYRGRPKKPKSTKPG